MLAISENRESKGAGNNQGAAWLISNTGLPKVLRLVVEMTTAFHVVFEVLAQLG